MLRIRILVVAAMSLFALTLVPVREAAAISEPVPGSLTVTPSTVELQQPFSISADECPGPVAVGADYRVEFEVGYIPALHDSPGDPDSGTYDVTLNSTHLGDGRYVATWSLPSNAPTLGGAYSVSGTCIGNELGSDFVWFEYFPASLSVVDLGTVLATSTAAVTTGTPFTATATGCPGANPVGASYWVEYVLEYLSPTQTPGSPPLGSFLESYSVAGAYGDHAIDITIPVGAPTLGGAYRLTAFCWGNELGSDFLWHENYTPVDLTVTQGAGTCLGYPVTVFVADGDLGTEGDDVILGSEQSEVINGLGGIDRICGGDGVDEIYGGAGIDLISGGAGDDVIHGDGGSDWIWADDGDDQIFGGSGADRLRGGNGDDLMFGMGGQDHMWGGPGHDDMQGNWQSDHMWGGSGHDKIRGAGGKDKLYGEAGDDELFGGRNSDWLDGGAGNDRANGQAGFEHPFDHGFTGCVAETIVHC